MGRLVRRCLVRRRLVRRSVGRRSVGRRRRHLLRSGRLGCLHRSLKGLGVLASLHCLRGHGQRDLSRLVGPLVDREPTAIELQLDDRGSPGLECAGQCVLEFVIPLDPEACRPQSLGNPGEIDGAQLGADSLAGSAFFLVRADRSVTAIVEYQHDHRQALPNCRFELGHRHCEAAVPGERDDLPAGARDRCGERSREGVAHRARCRAKEGTRPPEAVATSGPRSEIAGVGGEDGFRPEEPTKRLDHATGMDSRPLPWFLDDV